MKESSIWSEPCFYVECPYCGELEILGGGFLFNEETNICDKCNKEYKIKDEEY